MNALLHELRANKLLRLLTVYTVFAVTLYLMPTGGYTPLVFFIDGPRGRD